MGPGYTKLTVTQNQDFPIVACDLLNAYFRPLKFIQGQQISYHLKEHRLNNTNPTIYFLKNENFNIYESFTNLKCPKTQKSSKSSNFQQSKPIYYTLPL